MSSLAGQSKDHLSESNVNKDRLPKVKKDSFAEAMKEIEEIRERDIAKEILRINKKISVDRLHKDLRESVRSASTRLDDEALKKIKSKISSAESFAENLINKGKNDKAEARDNKDPAEDELDKVNSDGQDLGKLPIPPDLNNNNPEKINSIKNPRSTLLPERVRITKENNSETVIDADGRLLFDGSSSLGGVPPTPIIGV